MKKPILILFTVFFFSCETQEPILPELQTIDLEYFSDNGTSETISVQVVEDQGRINFLSNRIKMVNTVNRNSGQQGIFLQLMDRDNRMNSIEGPGEGDEECEPDIQTGWFYSTETNCLYYGTTWYFADCTTWFVPHQGVGMTACGIIYT